MSEIKRPLEGIKVVELATFIAAPCCARYLADLGAEVIKVEATGGDPLRFTAVNEGRPQDYREAILLITFYLLYIPVELTQSMEYIFQRL